MIATLLRVSWTNLKRDRVAQALTFLLPILFFTIFATVFGNQSDATSRVRIAIVDEDGSELSRRIVAGLQQETALRVRLTADAEGQGAPLDRAAAERMVRDGGVPVAVILPKGLGAGAAAFFGDPSSPHIQLLADVSDPVAPQMVNGLLQKVSMTAAPDLMMRGGLQQFEKHAGALTPGQRTAVDAWLPQLTPKPGPAAAGSDAGASFGGIAVDTVDVMRQGKSESLVSFYAAGVGVMFLLFSVSAGGGTLLDELDSGTLDRVLSTRVGMGGLLLGKWLFLALIGVLQLTVMFLWGRIAFGLDLFSHLPGFFVMTIATAAAAAGFGLMLATLARTRAQLSAISTILILTMSALGGSMFPRFLMTEAMQKLGLVTFNAWALDGYLKVFWRDAPVWQLWPQLVVLCSLAVMFLALARTFARRWETA
jgi:ABC-2 type transport system permease protein